MGHRYQFRISRSPCQMQIQDRRPLPQTIVVASRRDYELHQQTVPADPSSHRCIRFSTFSIQKVFPLGSLFKIELGTPPDHSDRSWHGTNLYCAHSVAKHGLRGSTPQHGPFGVYSFNDSRVWKMQFYCVYTLSGTGRAWTAIVELAIPDGKYQTVSKVQWCSQAEDTTIVAVWLHGLEYSEFRSEFIWPTWNPELEIQPRP